MGGEKLQALTRTGDAGGGQGKEEVNLLSPASSGPERSQPGRGALITALIGAVAAIAAAFITANAIRDGRQSDQRAADLAGKLDQATREISELKGRLDAAASHPSPGASAPLVEPQHTNGVVSTGSPGGTSHEHAAQPSGPPEIEPTTSGSQEQPQILAREKIGPFVLTLERCQHDGDVIACRFLVKNTLEKSAVLGIDKRRSAFYVEGNQYPIRQATLGANEWCSGFPVCAQVPPSVTIAGTISASGIPESVRRSTLQLYMFRGINIWQEQSGSSVKTFQDIPLD